MSKEKVIKNIIAPVIIVIISIVFAIIFNDYVFGLITLVAGFLNAYYMIIGKWYNYIFGIIFSITYSIVCFINGLYGFAIFTIILYTPIQITGLVKWFKKQSNDAVEVKSLSVKHGLLLTVAVCLFSAVLGFLLNLIPTQQMSYFDSVSQMINLCGIILSTLRYREMWYVWLANNVVDLLIWIKNFIDGSSNSGMMLVVSIMYFLTNIYGLINWIKLEKIQNKTA